MKRNFFKNSNFQVIQKSTLARIIGGNKEEEEYIIVYINGVPYRIKINRNGEQISEPERI